MEHLALEVFDLTGQESKFAALPENTVITITDTSEIFASGDVWSHSFTLNIAANAHIFGSAGEMHGSRLHEQINKRRARLWVEGLPLYLGYLKLDDEVEVNEEGDIDVSFESGQKTFEEMIEGAKASQVPMMGNVRFGVALWRKRWTHNKLHLVASAVTTDGRTSGTAHVTHEPNPAIIGDDDSNSTVFIYDGENDMTPVQEYPRMVFPKGDFRSLDLNNSGHIDCLNTDYPYDDAHPYCNVALCYQRYGYERLNEKNELVPDYSAEPEAQREYELMPANRVNSAPNFFVIYWIRALMKHLGIFIEENQMMDVEDLRRLFFVNTKCAYKEPEHIREGTPDEQFGLYQFLENGRLVAEQFGPKDGSEYKGHSQITKTTECGFVCTDYRIDSIETGSIVDPQDIPTLKRINIDVTSVKKWTEDVKSRYILENSYLHDAFATSECFPDVDISEVIRAIENGFGVRFLFDDNYRSVRIVLLRNILCRDEVQDIVCDIISDTKSENNIRGFRMTYGNTEDTHFYYKGFADLLNHKKEIWQDNSDDHDYSKWSLNEVYSDILNKITAFDTTCFVTPNTGNAYGIKVDENARRYKDLHPSLFEFAGFMDAEDGDCTGDEETIDVINVGFTPAIMNDLNMAEERKGVYKQQFALFVDETMRPRRPDLEDGEDYNDSDAVYYVDSVPSGIDRQYLYADDSPASNMKADDGIVKPGEFAFASDMRAEKSGYVLKANINFSQRSNKSRFPDPRWWIRWHVSMNIDGHVNEGYRLYLQDNFEPNDNGVSPIETHDWGLTLGIMRGSGSDAQVNYKVDPDDGENNDTWDIEPGSSISAHPDTCNSYGEEWDYDGKAVIVTNSAGAKAQLAAIFPDSNINLVNRNTTNYISNVYLYQYYMPSGDGHIQLRSVMFAESLGGDSQNKTYTGSIKDYAERFKGMTAAQMKAYDAGNAGFGILIDFNSSPERKQTFLELQRRAYVAGTNTVPMYLDNGVGSRYGRLSLKLRAEKLNPFYDSTQPESSTNRRYLEITNENLRQRGLCDQLYKEYSFLVRNSRIAIRTVKMTLAQLLAIDKTVRVNFGDITGFIKKMQYSVSNTTGLGMVTMEILYI